MESVSNKSKARRQPTTARRDSGNYTVIYTFGGNTVPRRYASVQSQKLPTKKAAPRREATAADAAKHCIPTGYALKNWNPTEAPILLLGSVFDANSIGKWIYDWTVFHHGPAQPMTDIAGDLWLLLIKLAGKMKRADECQPRIRYEDDQKIFEDFLKAGDRLWARLQSLLKACEEFMWKVAETKETKLGRKSSTSIMGKNSGCEFVDSIFGNERKLEETESLMQSMRLWNHRFDKNCEEIYTRRGQQKNQKAPQLA